jgi:hypothetical protein
MKLKWRRGLTFALLFENVILIFSYSTTYQFPDLQVIWNYSPFKKQTVLIYRIIFVIWSVNAKAKKLTYTCTEQTV